MPPKESTESLQYKASSLVKYFPSEFLVLLGYLRHAPKAVFDIFAPYVIYLGSDKHKDEEIVKSALENIKKRRVPLKVQITEDKQEIFDGIIHMLDLQKFYKAIASNQTKFMTFMKFWQRRNEQDQEYFYESSIKINILRPGYYLTEQIAKQEAQTNIGQRFKQEDSKNSLFFKEPRFLDKLAELIHFKKNKLHQGEIALLEYTGNFIIGRRVYAIAKGSQFEIWEKTSARVPYPFFEENEEAIPPDSDEEKSLDETESWRKPSPSFQLQRSFRFIGHTSKITCASLSQDELYIVTGSVDRTVKLWCLRLNICLATYKGHLKTVWDVHFNPSGLYFLSGGAEGLMILWKTDNSKPQRLFVHKEDIYKVHFAKNPSYAISAGEEGLLKIWDIVETKIVATIKTEYPIINFNLGHSGIYILVLETDGRVTVHNTALGKVVSSFSFHFKFKEQTVEKRQIIHDFCMSQDEKDIVCVTNKHILVYSMQSLELSLNSSKQMMTSKRQGSREKIVIPSLVLMSLSNLRFNFCRYRHRGLLVIGATKYLP